MTRARILADLGGVTSSATELNLLDGQTDIATQSELDAAEYNDNVIQTNIALLAFKAAANGSLAKYSLQDQVIDEYTNETGVDTSVAGTRVLTGGSYSGTSSGPPTVTEDSDSGPQTDGDYTWYKWTDTAATGSYEIDATADHEYLIIGGGGQGGSAQNSCGGGGGAGAYRTATGLSLTADETYTVTVGAGGNGTTYVGVGENGDDSSLSGTGITTITSNGGGGANRGGSAGSSNGNASAGGSGYNGGTASGGTYGNDSGTATTTWTGGGSGGGGSGGAGQGSTATAGGDGGLGTVNDITGSNVTYAGGGGGGKNNEGSGSTVGAGGSGVGGAGAYGSNGGYDGADYTGSGGGGSGGYCNNCLGGDGGSGIVILRRLTNVTIPGDLTLQSIDTTAEAAPTKADMIMLMEDTAGTATVNTDIKGFISRDSGTTFTEGTLVDEGDWGTNKRILAFHDLSFTSSSGTAMCYKITTHNQSATKETKIHATSIGWR